MKIFQEKEEGDCRDEKMLLFDLFELYIFAFEYHGWVIVKEAMERCGLRGRAGGMRADNVLRIGSVGVAMGRG